MSYHTDMESQIHGSQRVWCLGAGEKREAISREIFILIHYMSGRNTAVSKNDTYK